MFLVPIISQTISNWISFIIAMGISLSVARIATGQGTLHWVASVLNGFLIFAAAVGIELGASAAAPVVEPPGQTSP